jgi:hypothetical protein
MTIIFEVINYLVSRGSYVLGSTQLIIFRNIISTGSEVNYVICTTSTTCI